jgi:hypothetical protein
MVGLAEMGVRSYVAEPDRGPRNWDGKPAEKQAVHGNRRRVQGARGKRLQRQRGERIERNFAHQFDTGGLDRLYVRGLENVHKKILIQAAACNFALLLRSALCCLGQISDGGLPALDYLPKAAARRALELDEATPKPMLPWATSPPFSITIGPRRSGIIPARSS